jgi:hypothetical protein
MAQMKVIWAFFTQKPFSANDDMAQIEKTWQLDMALEPGSRYATSDFRATTEQQHFAGYSGIGACRSLSFYFF